MKIVHLNFTKKRLLVSFDFWEIESLGYDILKQKDVTGTFYQNIIEILQPIINNYFGDSFHYGLKTMIDQNKGVFYYEIMPYEERLEEFIVMEWEIKGKKWIWYNGRIL